MDDETEDDYLSGFGFVNDNGRVSSLRTWTQFSSVI
jgi:hypothetical protein